MIKLALACLAATAAYFVFQFTSQVADWRVAFFAAGSLVGTYLGLAFADIPAAQRPRAIYVARGAMVVEALYGFLYVLSLQSPALFEAPLSLWLSVPLAALHGAAFSVLAYFVSLFVVHAGGTVEQESAAEARDRAIIDTLRTIQEHISGTPVVQIAPTVPSEPVQVEQAPAQLPDGGTIEIGGKVYSVRQAATALGLTPTTLKRKLDKA